MSQKRWVDGLTRARTAGSPSRLERQTIARAVYGYGGLLTPAYKQRIFHELNTLYLQGTISGIEGIGSVGRQDEFVVKAYDIIMDELAGIK